MSKPRNLSGDIIKLFSEGKKYREIADELGCSIGNVYYHVAPGEKEKHCKRGKMFRLKEEPLIEKVSAFNKPIRTYKSTHDSNRKTNKILYSKYISFIGGKTNMANFTLQELKDKIGDSPKCYLTGRPVDLSKSRTYQLDHIVPASKGGDNTLENCGLACRDANQSKIDLQLEDYFQLCKEVLENNGFLVVPVL